VTISRDKLATELIDFLHKFRNPLYVDRVPDVAILFEGCTHNGAIGNRELLFDVG
jgi:hypothetical protein